MGWQGRGTIWVCAVECFGEMTIGGAEDVQPSSMGKYVKVANLTQGDRPVYRHEGSIMRYLFYWPISGVWFIDDDYAPSALRIRSTGVTGAPCPDSVADWEAFSAYTQNWDSSYRITVVGNGATFPICTSFLAPAPFLCIPSAVLL
jgi:hypothetical protein